MSKSAQKQEPSVTPAVTAPLFGGQQQQPPTGAEQQPPSSAGGWAGFTPAPVPATGYQQQQVPGYQGFQPAEPAPPANQPPAPAPVEEAPPAPIPAEHQVIQDTLENLRAKCQQGNNFQQNQLFAIYF